MFKRVLCFAALLVMITAITAAADNGDNLFWNFTSFDSSCMKLTTGSAEVRDGSLTVSGTTTVSLDLSKGGAKIASDAAFLEYDIAFNTTKSRMYIGNEPNGGSVLRVYQDGARVYVQTANAAGNGNVNVYIMNGVIQNRSYHFKYKLDYKFNTVSIYVDGEELLSGAPFFYNEKYDYSGVLQAIYFLGTDGSGNFAVDNIAAYADNDAASVSVTKKSLEIPAIVEGNLYLPKEGFNGTEIKWSTTDPTVITADGTVTRPSVSSGDKRVILSADITKNNEAEQCSFECTVPYLLLDSDAVRQDLAAVVLPEIIYDELSLPQSGEYGSEFEWTSENSAVISISSGGVTINRPEQDTTVKLILTATKNASFDEREFTVTVKRVFNDRDCVEADAEAISLPGEASGNFELPLSGQNNTNIEWYSDNETVIKIDGGAALVFNSSEDKTVTLRAVVTKGAETLERSFAVTVKKDTQKLNEYLLAAARALSLPTEAEGSITLPSAGEYGTAITWKSSAPDIISENGAVNLPVGKKVRVTLTATISKDKETKKKLFTVLVTGTGSTEGENGKKITILEPAADDGALKPAEQLFEDVDVRHWAYPYIQTLAENNIIYGIGDGMFMPERTITREEFVSLIVKAFLIDTQNPEEPFFEDISENDWFYGDAAAAYSEGLVSGISELEFGIGLEITREAACTIIARAIKLRSGGYELYDDDGEISRYAREAVYTLKNAGILSGGEAEFRPNDSLTRAEAARLIHAALAAEGGV